MRLKCVNICSFSGFQFLASRGLSTRRRSMFSAHARAARRSKINFVLSRNPRAFFFLVYGVFFCGLWFTCMCQFWGRAITLLECAGWAYSLLRGTDGRTRRTRGNRTIQMNSLTHCLSRKYMGDEMTTIATAQRSRSLLCISVHVCVCMCM